MTGLRGRRPAAARAALILVLCAAPSAAGQEHRHPDPPRAEAPAPADTAGMPATAMRPRPLGVPWTREGSGTSWLPDASPMHALHAGAGIWELMLHGSLVLHRLDDGGDRGHEQLGATHWIMGMARRPAVGGDLTLRAMVSVDPLTTGECGYPDLLATGESCDGEPLHDRQHPHDLFMELAGLYERGLADGLALQLYGGPVGEPALGPVAFPHRVSSFPNPIAPIGHHWLDSTHIAFGVATAGIYGRRWKAEASLFNGREPDAERYDFDLDALDSYAGRFWILPDDRWALQVSAGRLNEAELHQAGAARVDVARWTASAIWHRPVGDGGVWASTFAWGWNQEEGEGTYAVLAETALDLGRKNVIFGRLEVAEKTGGDLVLAEDLGEESFTVGKLGLGYVRQFEPLGGLASGLGVGVTVARVPQDLVAFYGSGSPAGLQLFFGLRPAPTKDGDHAHP